MLLAAPLVGAVALKGHPRTPTVATPQPWMRRDLDANLPEVHSRRARVVIAYCGQCHAPPPPELHSADEWRWLIVRMDMRAWSSRSPSVRVASNDELLEIAQFYERFSGE